MKLHQRTGKIITIMAAIVISIATIYALFDSGLVQLNHPSKENFPIQGIDVSHHQGQIDWKAIAADKTVQFAYIKATEGGDFKDPAFVENWREAREAGIARGAYHFFTFCRSGKDQAKNFLESVPQEPNTLPFAVDLEFGGNCAQRVPREALIAELENFLEEVQKIHPQRPVFYVTPGFYARYMNDKTHHFPAHDLWLRNIYYEPPQDHCDRWQLWQFANRGHIKGIEGPVDLNVFCADGAAFSHWRLMHHRVAMRTHIS